MWTGGTKNEERFVMTAYRCADRGFLEVYAREQAPKAGWLG